MADVIPTSRLDWAFAGTSSTELLPDPSATGREIVHSTWRHWVDSRYEDAESVVDEGDMYPRPDGRTLEKGRMINPETGQMTDYEEVWVDVDSTDTTTTTSVRADGHGEAEDGGSGRKVCTVLMLEDEEHSARGMVIRVGQFCQGVLRVGDGFCLERWEWAANTGWKRQVRMGDLFLPCGVTFETDRLRLGGEVKFGEFVWRVVECSWFD